MKKLVLLFLLISPNINFSQNGLDSLWQVWENPVENDTNRLNAIKNFIVEGYLFSDPDSAFFFGQLMFDFAKECG
ncbi:MAG: hypothetical protein ACI857_002339 [Arenicella sp.]|jgi:hypothetical protein